MSLLRDQVRKLQERLEFIEDTKIFQDPDSPSSFGSAHVSHQVLITSNSRKPSREFRMQRNTREDMSFPGNVFDCQLARRVLEELHRDSRNLATPSGIQRREGIEKSGSEEPLLFGKSEGKKSRRRELSHVHEQPCRGYRDLYSKRHDPELDCKLPKRGLLEGEESHTRFAVDQGNRSSQIAG